MYLNSHKDLHDLLIGRLNIVVTYKQNASKVCTFLIENVYLCVLFREVGTIISISGKETK